MPQDYPEDLQGAGGYCDEDAGRPFRRRVPQTAGAFYGTLIKGDGSGAGGSPLLRKGDVYIFSTDDDRLPVGADGTFLVPNSAVAAGLNWRALLAADVSNPAALTKADDTNVTLTLGGTPTAALLAAASITVGWTGTLAVSRGGTGLAAAGAEGQVLATVSGAPAWGYNLAQLAAFRTRGTLQRPGERWYGPTATGSYTAATGSAVVGKLYAYPLFCPMAGTIDKIGVYVSTGSIGSNCRFGLYASAAQNDPWPEALLFDSGSQGVSGSATAVTATCNVAVTAGTVLWLCFAADSATPTFSGIDQQKVYPVFGSKNDLVGTPCGCIESAFTYGAFPAYWPSDDSTPTGDTSVVRPRVLVRFKNDTGYLLYDTFSEPDGTRLGSSTHPMNYGGGGNFSGGWAENVGTWEINSGKARQTNTTGGVMVATADSGSGDGTYEFDLTTASSTDFTAGIAFRFSDTSNWWRFFTSSGTGNWRLIEHTASSAGTVRATYSVAPAANTTYHVKVVLSGTSISCYVDGTLAVSFTSSAQQTNQKHGLYESRSAGVNQNTFDLFKGTA